MINDFHAWAVRRYTLPSFHYCIHMQTDLAAHVLSFHPDAFRSWKAADPSNDDGDLELRNPLLRRVPSNFANDEQVPVPHKTVAIGFPA